MVACRFNRPDWSGVGTVIREPRCGAEVVLVAPDEAALMAVLRWRFPDLQWESEKFARVRVAPAVEREPKGSKS